MIVLYRSQEIRDIFLKTFYAQYFFDFHIFGNKIGGRRATCEEGDWDLERFKESIKFLGKIAKVSQTIHKIIWKFNNLLQYDDPLVPAKL